MATDTSRRNFLRARFRESDTVRPPGALGAGRFADLCDGCSDCVTSCPENIIGIDGDTKAYLSFEHGGCTFCGACIDACPTGALSNEAKADWDWVAVANDTCLAVNGTSCRTCEDFCDTRAIRFRLMTGGRSEPKIDVDGCTGCGACIGACPAGAIELARHQTIQLEATG